MADKEDNKGGIVKLATGKVKDIDKDSDDCYETDPIDFSRKLALHNPDKEDDGDDDDDELVIVSEKGPVALRDFPHPRHLCANFPFDSTSHESFCSKCFCSVCDIVAPCQQWTGASGHCNQGSSSRKCHAQVVVLFEGSDAAYEYSKGDSFYYDYYSEED